MDPNNFQEKFEIDLNDALQSPNSKQENFSSQQNSNQTNKEKVSSSSSPKIQNKENNQKYAEFSLESLYAKLNATNYRDYSKLGYRLTGLGGISMAMYKKSLLAQKDNNGQVKQNQNNKERQQKVEIKENDENNENKQKDMITQFNVSEKEIQDGENQVQQIERDVQQKMKQAVINFESEEQNPSPKDQSPINSGNQESSDQVILASQYYIQEKEQGQQQQQFPVQDNSIEESEHKVPEMQKYKISEELIIEEKSKELELEDELKESLRYHNQLSGSQQVQMRKITTQLKKRFVKEKIKEKVENSILIQEDNNDNDEKQDMQYQFDAVESVVVQISPQTEDFLKPEFTQQELKPQLPISKRKVTETRRKITAQILKIPAKPVEIHTDNTSAIPTAPQLSLPLLPAPKINIQFQSDSQGSTIPIPPKLNIISSTGIPIPPPLIPQPPNFNIINPTGSSIPAPPSLNIPQPPQLPGVSRGVPAPPKLIFPNCVSQSIKSNIPNAPGVPMPPTLGIPAPPGLPVILLNVLFFYLGLVIALKKAENDCI